MATTTAMSTQTKLSKQARLIVGMLSAQLLLGMAENLMGKPDDLHGADKLLSGIVLVLHVLIGLALIFRGTLALQLATQQGDKIVRLTRIGLASIVIAFVAGALIMATTAGDSWWSYLMTVAFLGAFLTYGMLLARGTKS